MMIIDIESKGNKILKNVVSLKNKKTRDTQDEFVIEGMNLVREATENKGKILYIIASRSFLNHEKNYDILEENLNQGIPVYSLSDSLFEYISDTKTPQGLLAVVKKPEFNFTSILEKAGSNLLVLDRIQDPGNLGTMLRTADASGIDGIVLLKGSADVFQPKVVRAAAGSLFRVPTMQIESDELAIRLLKRHGKKIIATAPLQAKYYYEVRMIEDIALIIGNEANGISSLFYEKADEIIKIPMVGNTESLNAAIASSIIMYEMLRQRMML